VKPTRRSTCQQMQECFQPTRKHIFPGSCGKWPKRHPYM
jgi:hypothetical protein